jgi:hypothetical protein
MGYSYCIRIALNTDVDIQEGDDLWNQLEYIYRDLLSKSDGWFPEFGIEGSSSSGGYGTGPNDHFRDEVVKFTSQFPEYMFFVYFFYFDMQCLDVFEIMDYNVNNVQSIDMESGIDVPGGKVFATFQSTMTVDNEILADNM